jgi:hypothetical protein
MMDFDNDGRIDVLVASSAYPYTYSLLWQQQADGTFVEVGNDVGTRILRSSGIGVIDYDRDGDYDVLMGTSLMRWGENDNPPAPDDEYAYLLRNDSGQDANKMILDVRGSGEAGGAAVDAVGARIEVLAGGVTHIREVQRGYGHNRGQNDQLMLIGIADACLAEQVTVTWPDGEGSVSTFTEVMPNHVAIITQGAKRVSYQTIAEYTAVQ